jgi:hypothetical protein
MFDLLQHAGWAIVRDGDVFEFGRVETGVWNRTTPVFGYGDVRVNDYDRPRSDGRGVGIDYMSGNTVSFDLVAKHPLSVVVRERVEEMRRHWRADSERAVAGDVVELQMRYDNRSRSVFGRPRRWAPNYAEATTAGMVTVQADFACVDDLFYGHEESESMTTAASGGSGWVTPFVFPLSSTRESDHSQFIAVRGTAKTWPTITIHGPVVNPKVRVGGRLLDLRATLAFDESVVVDARPWARSVTRNGVSLAGSLRGTRLAEMGLDPGQHEVTISGVDPTGTASVTFAWRSAYLAP